MVCAECMNMCCLGGKNSVVKGLTCTIVAMLCLHSYLISILCAVIINHVQTKMGDNNYAETLRILCMQQYTIASSLVT